MSPTQYVHGYSPREAVRLGDQANTLSALLHEGVRYAPGRRVLEVGCGTGAQTVLLAANSPGAEIVSIDRSAESIELARSRVEAAFVCFVLEHLREPHAALAKLRPVLKAGGTVTVIEGDHGSWYCHPQTAEATRTVSCLIEIQARLGGNALIGRSLYPLLCAAGFRQVRVIPRIVYVDDSRPDLVEGFSKNTFIAMVEGVRAQALSLGLIDEVAWDKGIADMYRATGRGGTFAYTFFQGTARA